LFFLNFGHLAEDKFRPFEVCREAILAGFNLNETFVWVKNHYRPIQGKKRVNNLTEFIFLFSKCGMPNLDRLSIGIPYADKSNVKRFAKGRDLKCRGNVWSIPYETIQSKEQKLHNDRFPLALPEACIKLSGIKPGSMVLDPFVGSGTTALAARNLKMDFVGFEINKKNYETAQARVGLGVCV
jgi:site-specific DNA-methyltransferase (adenine-specific)